MHNRLTLTLSATSALALAGWFCVSFTPNRGEGGTSVLQPEKLPAHEPSGEEPASVRAVVGQFCVGCHDGDAAKGGLEPRGRCRRRCRPPPRGLGEGRPPAARAADAAGGEEAAGRERRTPPSSRSSRTRSIARRPSKPNPGRTDTIRRLNRTEYQNAIRDLLGVHIDAAALLPADEASHGFDNVTVGDLSPTLLDRYITAAQKISRLAVGSARQSPGGDTIRVRPDITQEERVEGLPLGTRGGALIRYTFPQDGEYDIQIRLARDRNEHVEGLRETARTGSAARPRATSSRSP